MPHRDSSPRPSSDSIGQECRLSRLCRHGAPPASLVLAAQLSAVKGVPLWRLDLDKGVSADALESRLARYLGPADPIGTFSNAQGAFVVVDSLDEARMRVSGASWREFLDSLIRVSRSGHRLVMFGRERVLEDIWLAISEADLGLEWVEISHFDAEQRRAFVDAGMPSERDTNSSAYIAARDAVLDALAGTVDAEHSDAFVGYAPVLAAAIALLRKGNLKTIENTFSGGGVTGDRISVLAGVLESLLIREQTKTRSLAGDLSLDVDASYGPEEQIDWLGSELLGLELPDLSWCSPEHRGEYVAQVSEFLRDHPFRSENRWASPVFSAYVCAKRFDDPLIRDDLNAIGKGTGLLFEFVCSSSGPDLLIDEWQFAALHSSLLAAEWREAEAVVTVTGEADAAPADRKPVQIASGQLVLLEGGRPARTVDFDLVLDRADELTISGPASALSVTFPAAVVIRADGASIALGPDCFVRCQDLLLSGETVEISRRVDGSGSSDGSLVILEITGRFRSDATLTGIPPIGSLELRVPSATSLSYPWVAYRCALEPATAAPNDRAVRFLNMLIESGAKSRAQRTKGTI